jgi:hypothetical protein
MHHFNPSRFASRILFVGVLTLAASTTSALAADGNAAPVAAESGAMSLGTVPVPSGLSAAQVQSVVVRALVGRRWIIQEKTDGKVVAHYEHGKNAATLTVKSDEKTIEIFGTGSSRKGSFPIRWVDNLKKDMGVFLGRELGSK